MNDTGHKSAGHPGAGQSSAGPDDLLPLDNEQVVGFDVVRFGGYDRRQVDDYLDRVEVALTEADQRHADDMERLASLQAQLQQVEQRLAETERRTSGRPEPASLVAGRMTEMLALAEQEADALLEQARSESDRVCTAAKEQAAVESSELLADLQRRERELAKASETAAVSTVQAQRDAEAVRSQAKRDADNQLATAKREAEAARASAVRTAEKTVEQARQDVQGLHEQARQEAAAMTAEARKQVEHLSRQRDDIATQLQQLRDAVSAAVAPLGVAPTDALADQSGPRQGAASSSRVRPGD